MNKHIIGMGVVAAAIFGAAVAQANQAQDAAALQNFRLTDAFLVKYEAVEDDAAKDPCNLDPVGLLRGGNKSLDQLAAEYEAQPGVKPMLARHGLTAREEILGATTLMLAGFEVMQKEHPGMVQTSGTMPPVSAANLAFYKSHQAAMHQHAMQLGERELKANHGKLPACMASHD